MNVAIATAAVVVRSFAATGTSLERTTSESLLVADSGSVPYEMSWVGGCASGIRRIASRPWPTSRRWTEGFSCRNGAGRAAFATTTRVRFRRASSRNGTGTERTGDESPCSRCSAGVLTRSRGCRGPTPEISAGADPARSADGSAWKDLRPGTGQSAPMRRSAGRSPFLRRTRRRRSPSGESANGGATNHRPADVSPPFPRGVVARTARTSRSGIGRGRRGARGPVGVHRCVPQRHIGAAVSVNGRGRSPG